LRRSQSFERLAAAPIYNRRIIPRPVARAPQRLALATRDKLNLR